MIVIESDEVGKLIKDNDMVAISGSGGSGSCEAILRAIRDSYIKNNHPKNIGVTCGISPGNLTEDEVGMNMLAKPGLVGKAICAHLGMGKVFGNAIGNNEFPAFALPLGVINHLYRAIAGGELGIITHIGLNTFADPRINGCRANEKAKELPDIVSLIKIENQEQLFYKTFKIDVAIIKATYADEDGNLSLEHEALIGEQYNMAIAAHNSKGIVIAQVEKIVPKGSLKARNAIIHSSYVDYVLVSEPELTLGDYNMPIYRPEIVGDIKIPLEEVKINELNSRKICGRRAALEIKKGNVINLGVGMPDTVANIAAEEGFADKIFLSVETGPIGGVPIGGVAFGGSINPDSVVSTPEQFDAYNGGSLDMAILGLAEVDEEGNVNVSKFGTRVTGPGGFINITQSTKKVIFIGTFTAKGLKEEIKDAKLIIENEGTEHKFVKKVEQITFSAKQARLNKQEILYVTERAVFKLDEKGITLIEIAPGVDIIKDIFNQMDFRPNVAEDLRLMDEKIFKSEKMNLKV
ncbi:MAG: acyl CoA:acetate/3-ketoacid CoA transferase [Bacilli bacterium]